MTLGGILLLATIIAVVVGYVRVKEQGERISVLEERKAESKEKQKK